MVPLHPETPRASRDLSLVSHGTPIEHPFENVRLLESIDQGTPGLSSPLRAQKLDNNPPPITPFRTPKSIKKKNPPLKETDNRILGN